MCKLISDKVRKQMAHFKNIKQYVFQILTVKIEDQKKKKNNDIITFS